MGKPILLTKLKREKGKLYYVGTSVEGHLVIFEALLKRGGTKKEKWQKTIIKKTK